MIAESKIDRRNIWCNHHTHSKAWEYDINRIVAEVLLESTDDEACEAFAREEARGTLHDADTSTDRRIITGLQYLIEERIPSECHQENPGLTIEIGMRT